MSYSQNDNIPETKGFSGVFIVSPGYTRMSSNQIATGPPLLNDIGHEVISSIYDPPESKTAGSFALAGEIIYTFAKSRTQVYFGNRLEDLLRLDGVFGLGVRQELKDKSILAASILTTPINVYFWSDPYVENQERIQSDLDRHGLRLRWGRILKTGLEITLTYRRINYANERSGDYLVEMGELNPEDQLSLNRNGSWIHYQFLYRIDKGQHRFEPMIIITDNDRKGQAMAGTVFKTKLTYLYLNPKKIILDINVGAGYKANNEVHPIYEKTLSSYRYGVAVVAIKPIIRKEKSVLNAFIGVEFYREYANISFFDSYINWGNGGLIWRYLRE